MSMCEKFGLEVNCPNPNTPRGLNISNVNFRYPRRALLCIVPNSREPQHFALWHSKPDPETVLGRRSGADTCASHVRGGGPSSGHLQKQ